jgi:hypothetical protein
MLPQVYQSQSSAIASYNYSDLAENTGVKMFYLAVADDGVGIITQNQVYSDYIEQAGAGSSATYEKILDNDYDLSAFNAPQMIRGTALFTYSYYGTPESYVYTKILIRKWDGTTETEIANGTSVERHHSPHIELLKIAIPLTVFKVGEQLRITVELYLKTAAGPDQAGYGTDPMNRDGTYVVPSTDVPTSTSTFKCWIPFNLDL